jgi:hypothetical protein
MEALELLRNSWFSGSVTVVLMASVVALAYYVLLRDSWDYWQQRKRD